MPKSHSHYQDFLDLRGDGRVVLYKRADHQNPKWTVRLKIPTVDGFVVKPSEIALTSSSRRIWSAVSEASVAARLSLS